MSHHHKHGECHDHDSCCSNETCSDDSCCGHHHHHHHKDEKSCNEDFAKDLLHVADCAWMELLKEKIKAEISSACGEHLGQIAKIVAESNGSRWQHKLAMMKAQDDYKEKLKNLFCCSSSCKK